jgi:hypothetical protein
MFKGLLLTLQMMFVIIMSEFGGKYRGTKPNIILVHNFVGAKHLHC